MCLFIYCSCRFVSLRHYAKRHANRLLGVHPPALRPSRHTANSGIPLWLFFSQHRRNQTMSESRSLAKHAESFSGLIYYYYYYLLLLLLLLLFLFSNHRNFIGHIKQHFMTSPVTYITNGIQDSVKCCIKGSVHLDLPPSNRLFKKNSN